MRFIGNHARGIKGFIHLALHVGKGLIQLYWLQYRYGASWHTSANGLDTIRAWMQQLVAIFNISITQHGHPAGNAQGAATTLYLSNHVSWLDIIIISSLTHVKFVSKDDLLFWPFIGKLAKNSGTLFLDRKNRFALRDMLKQIQYKLENGLDVLIFPEGTTTNGQSVAAFRNGLIQAAINSQSQVQTLTLRYIRNGELCTLSPYINDDMFLSHAYRLLCQPATEVTVYFDNPQSAGAKKRSDIALDSRQTMIDNLSNTIRSTGPGKQNAYVDRLINETIHHEA